MVALAPDRAVEAASASSGEPPSPDAQVTAARSSPLSAPAEPTATMVAAAADASGVALPATAPPRVVIRYPEGDTAAWSAAQELRASLQASGIQIVAVAAAGRRVTRETVRYYYDQDRPVAEDIADRLGPPFTGPAQMAAVGPTDQPRAPGTIEVAVPPGRATSAR